MAVNFLGARMLTEALFPRITGGGAVVNVASLAGREWQRRADVVGALLETPDFESGMRWCHEHADRWAKDPYTFSKQCLSAWTLRLAGRGIDRRVRVNAVSPGGVATPLSPSFREQVGSEQFDWAVRQIGRQAEPQEIAEVIEYLAVGRSRWINGVDIVVDGGLVAGMTAGWIDVSSSPAARARMKKTQPA
jgi:NAD(P)-dependent dehydrogenase (short-subunit alcohol dehydrogenase family)